MAHSTLKLYNKVNFINLKVAGGAEQKKKQKNKKNQNIESCGG
jgi:hypothetical protein